MSAASIHRQLQDNGSIKAGTVSESTVNRYVNQLALEMKTTTKQDIHLYDVTDILPKHDIFHQHSCTLMA